MDRLKKSDLRTLLKHEPLPRLSVYMPTHRAGSEIQQDPIRLKNLLGQAEDRLSDYGLRRPEVQEFLVRANDLLRDAIFWQQQSDGLVLFAAPDLFRHYRLPLDFEESLSVGDQFYITPLFPLFQNAGQFHILALSQGEVRLLEGTKYGVEEVELERLPRSLAEALKWDDPERQLQGHTASRGRQGGERGRPDMTFHGHGVGTDDEKTNILRFFQKVDKALSDFLAGEQTPVVLAGVEYLLPIYREANSYNYLAEGHIAGNPEDLRAETLHARARELLAPGFKREQEESAELYRQQAGAQTGRASKQIAEIVPAAYSGRVGRLFIQKRAQTWGQFDLANNRVDIHSDRTPASEELLNTAALYTLQNDGAVYVVEQSEMPDDSAIAAVFRY